MKPFNLEEYLANPSRKVVTRDGRKVRIICTDAKGVFPIIALVERCDATFGTVEEPITYTKGGDYYSGKEHIFDLFFATNKHEGWINVYMNCNERTVGALYSSKEDALEVAKVNGNYLASVKIEWEE